MRCADARGPAERVCGAVHGPEAAVSAWSAPDLHLRVEHQPQLHLDLRGMKLLARLLCALSGGHDWETVAVFTRTPVRGCMFRFVTRCRWCRKEQKP